MDTCYLCKKKRDGKWALLFGPTYRSIEKTEYCPKYHICPLCFEMIVRLRAE